MTKNHWWSEKYGFFGEFYMKGDNSINGYLSSRKQSLAKRTTIEVEGVRKLLKLKPGSKILDCPCGYGRHSNLLAKNFSVVGVDINSRHLKKAREDAKKMGVYPKYYKQNMLNLASGSEFDALINMFYPFGFFTTDEENERALRAFYKNLKKGGKFLMHTDVNIPRIISGKYKENETRQLQDGSLLKICDEYHKDTKRIEGYWTVIGKDGEQITKRYSVRVYTRKKFESLCKKVGFRDCVAYSDWQGSPYSEESEDMIIVATK